VIIRTIVDYLEIYYVVDIENTTSNADSVRGVSILKKTMEHKFFWSLYHLNYDAI